MFNIFNSNVLIEIGEAIGNVRKKLFQRRSHAEELDKSFRRHLLEPLPIKLPDISEQTSKPGDDVIEGVYRVVEEEEVNLTEYRGYHDAYDHLGRFLDEVYMHKRIHSSLGYLTPAEFEVQWLTHHVVAQPFVT